MELSFSLKQALIHVDKVAEKTVEHLAAAVAATSALTSPDGAAAQAYARGMTQSYMEFGIDGLKTQTQYLLINLSGWRGDEAREAKKTLKYWSTH